jgi:uncharacterized protein YcaQ
MTVNLTRLYFQRQLLHEKTKADSLRDVAASICGVNAQRGITIYLSFQNRMRDFRKEDLDRALYQTKELVKIWCMRGTVHIIPSAQFEWYQKATTPSRLWQPSDISEDFCEKVVAVLEEPLTKSEITERIMEKVAMREKELRTKVGRAVRVLGYNGVIVFGNPRGTGVHVREYEFALAENWLQPDKSITEDEARKILLTSYMRCYGPATVQDFAYWAGFKVREARKICESVDLEEVKIGSRSYMKIPGDSLNYEEENSIVLLPPYDSYVMGHKDKKRIIEEQYKSRVFLPLASVAATIVKNGQVIGTWKTKKDGSTLVIWVGVFEESEEHDMDSIQEEIQKIARLIDVEYRIIEE